MSTDYDQIMRKSHITFINEIMRQTKTRDSMNDYYPNRLWLDTDTGTYGDANTLVVIDTTDWTQEDCDTWETMTDSERNHYGCEYKRSNGTTPTPSIVHPRCQNCDTGNTADYEVITNHGTLYLCESCHND